MIEQAESAPEPEPRRAVRWLRNGDHPGDNVGQQELDPVTGEPWTRQEGAVVRWYRRPDRPGSEPHRGRDGCWKPWRDHGWIDQGAAGLTVCPGMLVVDEPDGTHTVAKLKQVYRDRTENYVPAGLNLDGKERHAEISEGREGRSAATLEVYMSTAVSVMRHLLAIMEGTEGTSEVPAEQIIYAAKQWLKHCAEPADYERPRKPRTARIAMAMPDEYNRDQGDWWWADVSGDGTHWAQFRGHHTQVDIEFSTMNYRDTHEWKGRDDIQAGGAWKISLNRQPVYDGHIGDPMYALDRLREKLHWLLSADNHALNLSDPRPFHDQLVGRRVYWHDVPAVITSTVLDQGCVILAPIGRAHFPRQARDLDAEPDGSGHDEQDLWDEYEERTVKVEIDSPHIWWWRKRPFAASEADERYRPNRKGRQLVKQKSRWEPLSESLPVREADEAPAEPRGEQVDEATAERAREAVRVEAEDDADGPDV